MTFKLTGRAKRNLNETREIGITTASQPSARFALIETAARRVWSVRLYAREMGMTLCSGKCRGPIGERVAKLPAS